MEAPQTTDLLPLLDPKRDAVNGTWRVDHDTLVGQGGSLVRLRVPYKPAAEYQLRITFARTTGHEGMMVMCPTPKGPFMVVFNPDNLYFEDRHGSFNKTPHRVFGRGELCNVTLRVQHDRVEALVDGQLIAEFNPADRELGIQDGWRVGDDKSFGLGNWNTTVVFSKLELIEPRPQG